MAAGQSATGLIQEAAQSVDNGEATDGDNGEATDGDDSPSNSPSQTSALTEIRQQAVEVLLDCLNNTAAVHLHAKSYFKAKEAATQAIQHDGNNIKALCRAAKAAMLDPAASFNEGELAIKCAEEVDSENRDVKAMRAQLERTRKEYLKREKAMYAKMIRGISGADHVELSDRTNNTAIMLCVAFYITFLLALGFWFVMKDEWSMRVINGDNEFANADNEL